MVIYRIISEFLRGKRDVIPHVNATSRGVWGMPPGKFCVQRFMRGILMQSEG